MVPAPGSSEKFMTKLPKGVPKHVRRSIKLDLDAAVQRRKENCCTDDRFEWRPIWATTREDIGAFGVGMQLYFEWLFQLILIFLVVSFLSLPNLSLLLEQGIAIPRQGDLDVAQLLAIPTLANFNGQEIPSSYAVIDALSVMVFVVWVIHFRYVTLVAVVRQNDEQHTTPSDFTVQVEGLPRILEEDHQKYEELLKSHFEKVLRTAYQIDDPRVEFVCDVSLAREYNGAIYLFQRQARLFRRMSQTYARIEKLYRRQLPPLRENNQESIKLLTERLRNLGKQSQNIQKTLTNESERIDEEREVCFAFITFNYQSQQERVLHLYRKSMNAAYRYCRQHQYLRFQGRALKVFRAPEPSTLLWENVDFSHAARFFRKFLGAMFSVCVFLAGMFIIMRAKVLGSGSAIMQGLSSFAVIVVNAVERLIFESMDAFERPFCLTEKQGNLFWKIFMSLTLNTGFAVVLANMETVVVLVDEPLYDVEPVWYIDVGFSLFVVLSAHIFAPHSGDIGRYILRLIYRRKVWNSKTNQDELIDLFQEPQFVLAFKFANVSMMVFCVLLYSAGLPLILWSCTLSFFVTYWCDKFTLLRASSRPPQYSQELSLRAITWCRSAVLAHFAGTAFFLSFTPEFDAQREGFVARVQQILVRDQSFTVLVCGVISVGVLTATFLIGDRGMWLFTSPAMHARYRSLEARLPMWLYLFLFWWVPEEPPPEDDDDLDANDDPGMQWSKEKSYLESLVDMRKTGVIYSYRMSDNPRYLDVSKVLYGEGVLEDPLTMGRSQRTEADATWDRMIQVDPQPISVPAPSTRRMISLDPEESEDMPVLATAVDETLHGTLSARRRAEREEFRCWFQGGSRRLEPLEPQFHSAAGYSELISAVTRGSIADVEELLEEGVEDLEHADERGHTAVSVAAMWGFEEVLARLLEAGARGYGGTESPLKWAVVGGHVGCVKLLLAHGVHVAEKHREELETLATQCGIFEIVDLISVRRRGLTAKSPGRKVLPQERPITAPRAPKMAQTAV
mmetsp:Transcript_1966/g.4602  ORF Transcript_1966/g.4602 Transcript_1966/m.4602 type:complete len:1016 (+) Transcript_1966:78-3125(+)